MPDRPLAVVRACMQTYVDSFASAHPGFAGDSYAQGQELGVGAQFLTMADQLGLSADKTAIVWNADAGEPIHTLRGHTKEVLAVAYGRDGTTVATASSGMATAWTVPFYWRLRRASAGLSPWRLR